jgi:hypothetical protein
MRIIRRSAILASMFETLGLWEVFCVMSKYTGWEERSLFPLLLFMIDAFMSYVCVLWIALQARYYCLLYST